MLLLSAAGAPTLLAAEVLLSPMPTVAEFEALAVVGAIAAAVESGAASGAPSSFAGTDSDGGLLVRLPSVNSSRAKAEAAAAEGASEEEEEEASTGFVAQPLHFLMRSKSWTPSPSSCGNWKTGNKTKKHFRPF